MDKQPWEMPEDYEESKELLTLDKCYNAALTQISQQEEKIKELINMNNLKHNEIVKLKSKLESSQDHYDNLLEKILGRTR